MTSFTIPHPHIANKTVSVEFTDEAEAYLYENDLDTDEDFMVLLKNIALSVVTAVVADDTDNKMEKVVFGIEAIEGMHGNV